MGFEEFDPVKPGPIASFYSRGLWIPGRNGGTAVRADGRAGPRIMSRSFVLCYNRGPATDFTVSGPEFVTVTYSGHIGVLCHLGFGVTVRLYGSERVNQAFSTAHGMSCDQFTATRRWLRQA
jgi:hypothetical protein